MSDGDLTFDIAGERVVIPMTPRLYIAFEDEYHKSIATLSPVEGQPPLFGDIFRLGYVGAKIVAGYAKTFDEFAEEAQLIAEVPVETEG